MPTYTYRYAEMAPDAMDPAPYNPREIDEEELQNLRTSIRRFGFTGSVVWNEATGHIVGGHQRVLAARLEGVETVPVSIVDLTLEEEMLLNVALNQISGRFVDAKLAEVLATLQERNLEAMGLALTMTGFAEAAIADILGKHQPGHGKTPDDHVDPITEAQAACPITRPGDIIKLGDHLLICGDATDPDTLARLMHGEQAQAYVTDPPYNAKYQVDLTDEQAKKGKRRRDGKTVANDAMDPAAFRAFLDKLFASAARFLVPGGGVYIYHADRERIAFEQAATDAGFPVRQTLVWVKSTFSLGQADYHWQHEPCLYGWKEGAAHQWYGGRAQATVMEEGALTAEAVEKLKKEQLVALVLEMLAFPSTVIREPKPSRSEEHPTSKPVALWERPMLNSTVRGDLVVDTCCGYGPAFIAGEKHGRIVRGVELDPAYCDAIVRRWEAWTGKTAER